MPPFVPRQMSRSRAVAGNLGIDEAVAINLCNHFGVSPDDT
jgi:hypothetical protein